MGPMGGADRVSHQESGNAPANVCAKRASLASFIKKLLAIWNDEWRNFELCSRKWGVLQYARRMTLALQ